MLEDSILTQGNLIALGEGEDNLETEEEWEWQGEKNDQRTETCQ